MTTQLWRAHNPWWAWAPDSGDGAATTGGRFNVKGVPALYTSTGPMTAMAEAQQSFARKTQPMTMVAYDVECDHVLDLTDPATLAAEGIATADMQCTWRLLASTGQPVPSRILAKRLMARGVAAIIVPSYEPSAPPGESNVVFWNWSRVAPHRVEPIDDHNRLPPPPSRVGREQRGMPQASWGFRPADVFALARSQSGAGGNPANPHPC